MVPLVLSLILMPFNVQATTILLIGEANDTQLVDLFAEAQNNIMEIKRVFINHDLQEESEETSAFCDMIVNESFSAIVDLTWGGWAVAEQLSLDIGIPYVQIEVSTYPSWQVLLIVL